MKPDIKSRTGERKGRYQFDFLLVKDHSLAS